MRDEGNESIPEFSALKPETQHPKDRRRNVHSFNCKFKGNVLGFIIGLLACRRIAKLHDLSLVNIRLVRLNFVGVAQADASFANSDLAGLADAV